ncbi:MAG TPA: hypothetical protein VMW16_05940 [Sedimentisphaerales bacterium]|nr:hypothetical protein [Sedimentisphaerales bacterium]
MDYKKTIVFTGDVGKALEVARNVFIQHSFQIVTNTNSTLELTGTFTLWVKGMDPLNGISKISVRGTRSELSIEAKFGGISKTINYLIIFILAMAVLSLITFGTLFTIIRGQPIGRIILLSLAPFVPWPALIPLMAKFLKYRTSRALDALVHNMAALSK